MKYGCIGERLGHSFSREIHRRLGYGYELLEIPRDGLEAFLLSGDFSAINVTIPYKESVIPYLYETDEDAGLIGAVNTVVNRGGRLYGYNTDVYGLTALIRRAGIELRGRRVAVLGTGGTSKTARAVAKRLGAAEIYTVSRAPKDGEIGYGELYERALSVDVIINTTPVGMFPKREGCPVDISCFKKLSGVVDAVYNPLSTRLVLDARSRGVPAEGGLYMLVAQAIRASEIFLDKRYPEDLTEKIYHDVLREKENIVLIGMPSSGKTTVGKILAERLSRELSDTDRVVEEMTGRLPHQIISERGEEEFRRIEAEAVSQASSACGRVIATGGGAPLRKENLEALRSNGRISFLDRPLESLTPTEDRPLTNSECEMKKKYEERYPIYLSACDVKIDADCSANEVAERILEDFCK